MLRSGLVSVSFRKLSCSEIVSLVTKAGLDAVEWGGDIHVPHGDVAKAKEVRGLMDGAGLRTASYGSYYRVGDDETAFEAVLDCAAALASPTVRVWAGRKGSADTDDAYRAKVVEDARRIGQMAAKAGVEVAFEYHRNTLTDDIDSAERLMQDVADAGVKCYWQPPVGLGVQQCLTIIERMKPWLKDVHVFSWGPQGERYPLADGQERWSKYIAALNDADRYLMLEFVKDDLPEQFLTDAETLKRWLNTG